MDPMFRLLFVIGVVAYPAAGLFLQSRLADRFILDDVGDVVGLLAWPFLLASSP